MTGGDCGDATDTAGADTVISALVGEFNVGMVLGTGPRPKMIFIKCSMSYRESNLFFIQN